MILRAIVILLLVAIFLSGISSPAFSETTEDGSMNILNKPK